jgi:CRP/FNR family transcriptional regulator
MELVDLTRLRSTCSHCSRAQLCLPLGVSRTDISRLESLVRQLKPLVRGATLYRAGDPLESIYLVRSGSLKATLEDDNGDQQIIGFFLPGELMGFDALGTNRHTCTAEALELSSLCTLPYRQLTEVCRSVPDLHESLLRMVGREMSVEQDLLLTINRHHAEARVAAFLVSLSNRFQRLGYSPFDFRLPATRAELGNYLGLTVETVSRSVTQLQERGMISVARRRIRIPDFSALHRLCHGSEMEPPARRSHA